MNSDKIEGLIAELERCLGIGVSPHYSVVESVVKVLKEANELRSIILSSMPQPVVTSEETQ